MSSRTKRGWKPEPELRTREILVYMREDPSREFLCRELAEHFGRSPEDIGGRLSQWMTWGYVRRRLAPAGRGKPGRRPFYWQITAYGRDRVDVWAGKKKRRKKRG